jgi:hypothetical protein
MEITELLLTAIVLDTAKQLRKESANDLTVEPPSLEPYLEPAVKQLMAWHPLVMQAVLKSST